MRDRESKREVNVINDLALGWECATKLTGVVRCGWLLLIIRISEPLNLKKVILRQG